jgi:hypothetical protein
VRDPNEYAWIDRVFTKPSPKTFRTKVWIVVDDAPYKCVKLFYFRLHKK